MSMIRLIHCAAAALAVAMSNGAFASPEAWQRADDEYQVQRFRNALEIYEQIAMTGDARAAEVAGHMLMVGEALYGDSVRRDPARAARLLSQAANAGRPVAMHLLRHVAPTPVAPIANQ